MGQKVRSGRRNFNGGEIGPQLAMRAELEMYAKSCLTLRNFLPTLYGPAKSRPGVNQTRYYGSAAAGREFNFEYSVTTVYRVLLLSDGSFHVFEIGNLPPGAVPASNATVFSSDTTAHDYADEDLTSIFFNQSGDVIFLYHPGYPVMRIERHAVDDWRMTEHVFTAGPWMEWNLDDTLLSVELDAYDVAAVYGEGVYVYSGGSDEAVTDAGYVYWYKEQVNRIDVHFFYLLEVSIGSHSVEAGDSVVLSGFSGEAAPINGVYTVKRVTDDAIQVDIGTYDSSQQGWTNHYDLTGTFGSAIVEVGGGNAFFVSLQDGNTGNALPVAPAIETAYWRKTAKIDELTLRASSDLFSADSVTQKVFAELDIDQTYSGQFDAAGLESEWVSVFDGTVSLRTDGGIWGGVCALQVSYDGGVTWTSIGEINGMDGKHNEVIERDIEDPNALVRVYMKEYMAVTGETGCYWLLTIGKRSAFIGEITAYTDAKTVTVRAETALTGLFQTSAWRLGAISPANGYPACGWIHEERHYVAGIPALPSKGFASKTNNWNVYSPGTLATSAFDLILPSSQNEQILWGVSQSGMVVGSTLSEWQVSPRNRDESISFENISIERISKNGSARVQPVIFRDSIFYFGTDLRTVYAISYVYEKDSLLPKKVDVLAPHLPAADAVMMCATYSPEPMIWVLDSAGGICALLFDEENNVLGWSTQTFGAAGMGAPVSLIAVRKNGLSYLGINGWAPAGLGNMLYEMALDGNDLANSDSFFSDVNTLDTARIDTELEPTVLTQDGESYEGGSVWKASDIDLMVIDSDGAEVWESGMTEGKWLPLTCNAGFTGRIRERLTCRSVEEFRLKIRAADNKRLEVAAFALNLERTNSEVV